MKNTKRKIRRVNAGDVNSTVSITGRPATSYALATTPPPRVSPHRIRLVVFVLTVGGFAAIAADCWMSWEGFKTMPVDWWVAATLTALVAASQLGSGVIQNLGGDPFKGVGGSASGDGMWGMTLRGLYGLDIFSNFSGFGGVPDPFLWKLMSDPLGTLGLLLWTLVLAILLAFGDEILFRLRDRIAIGAQRNQQLAEIRSIQVATHNTALRTYRARAMEAARRVGEEVNIEFDWMENNSDDV